jgi:SAM-dependent methyltransferase
MCWFGDGRFLDWNVQELLQFGGLRATCADRTKWPVGILQVKRGRALFGIDKDPVEINKANSHLPIVPTLDRIQKSLSLIDDGTIAAPKVQFLTHDCNNPLPFPDCCFDGIYMGEVIEHCDNPYNVLQEMFRVLKPRGFVILSTPNASAWKLVLMSYHRQNWRIRRVLKEEWGTGDEKEHLYCWTIFTMVRLLKKVGFTYQMHTFGGSSMILKVRRMWWQK